MILRSLLCLTLLCGATQAFAEATRYPLKIQSCNREVIFKALQADGFECVFSEFAVRFGVEALIDTHPLSGYPRITWITQP